MARQERLGVDSAATVGARRRRDRRALALANVANADGKIEENAEAPTSEAISIAAARSPRST
jgi:hypothetical protein